MTPKKVVKSTVAAGSMKSDGAVKAKKTLQTSGTVDDAANLFLSRWANED